MPRALPVITCVVAAATLAPAALGARDERFKTGRYAGTTSQGYRIGLTLKQTKRCGGPEKLVLCLIQNGPVRIAARCSDGTSETDPHRDIVQVALRRSGIVFGSSTIEQITYRITVAHNGKLSGFLSFTGSKLTNDSVQCRSGKVTFTAKHTG